MAPTSPGASPHLVGSLARVAKKHRVSRKLVVAPNASAGRELLRRLSLTHGGWIGFEVTTPRPLALRLARPSMERAGLTTLDAFEEQAMLDHALDSAVIAEGGGLGELSEGVGFREKVHDAIRALRLAGITPEELDGARLSDWRKRLFLLRVLQRYERLLTERGRADTATVLRLGAEALDDAGGRLPPPLDAEAVTLLPGLGTRGLTGELVAALAGRGARVLETDAVRGLDVPDAVLWNRGAQPSPGSALNEPESGVVEDSALGIEFFRAASVNDELREALRLVTSMGLRWDQVEILTPDPAAYGSALHALSTRLRIPVTYAVGLPIERTRTGRVVAAYLDWIEEGFQAGPIRRLLEAGDLRPPHSKRHLSAAALARRLRSLRVGWGRKRYRVQIRAALSAVDQAEARKHETPEAFEFRRQRTRQELQALRSVLFPALKATPTVPDRMGAGGAPVSAAELARGLRAFLRRVPRGRGPDRAARDDVGRILERVEATLRRRTEFRAAVSILRRHLELRVRADSPSEGDDETGAPWASHGGALHLSDLEHGGYTGREAVFLIGFDAERVPGNGGQDPVLLDGDRRVLGRGLPTSSELLKERAFRFAALFARLRGSVTMSYTAWNAADARAVGPSPWLLQALRLSRRDATLTFNDLEDALGPAVSAIAKGSPLDRDDVWMSAIGRGGVMHAGLSAIRATYPYLDRGLAAAHEKAHGTPGAAHGVVLARPELLDPRKNPALVVSASRLQDLGTCPLRYLQSAVLRIYPPDDPELDPDRWLDPLRRGGLLHSVYEGTLREARERGIGIEDAGFEHVAMDVLAGAIGRARQEIPAPGEGTLAREIAGLEEDVRSFVRMVRQHGARWTALELKFGLGGDEPIALELDGGSLRLRGAIDRVDEDLQGVRVVDYKTGRPHGFEGKTGAFNGGRRLQHSLYALAAQERLGNDVIAGEYHFPTRRGENQIFAFDRLSLAGVDTLLGHMLDGVAEGSFVPTENAGDCTFCDYAEICRVHRGDWGKTTSPLAEWSQEHFNAGVQPAFANLKRARGFEG